MTPEDFGNPSEAELPAPVPEEGSPAPDFQPPFPRPLTASRAFFIFLMYLVAQFAAAIVVMVLVIIAGWKSSEDLNSLISQRATIPAAVAALVLGGVVIFRMTRDSYDENDKAGWLADVGWVGSSRRDLTIGLGLGMAVAFTYLFGVGSLLPPSDSQLPGPLLRAALSSPLARLGWSVLAVFIAPLIEEFLFRGVLFTGFVRSWGMRTSSILTIVIFTLLHLTEVAGYWAGLIGIAMLAVTTTGLRIRTGSFQPSIAAHAGYNLSMVLMLYASPT
jgi:membrane protease YdiL (CAAX protease family)